MKLLFGLVICFSMLPLFSADWRMWRYDAGHSCTSPDALAPNLYLQWQRELGTPAPAWPSNQKKLRFDDSYEPVADTAAIYVPSMSADKVTAYDVSTGKEKWRFYADAPVRFAPLIYKNKLFFGSDDGYLYCLDKANGKLISKKMLAPKKRQIIGNERIINIWPVRGAPVLFEDKIYVSAGIWPFMGIFIYCINADTGKIVWCNSGSGSIFIKQQHYSPAFAGVAPQGYMTVVGEKLLVPGGRTVPAVYDRHSGKFLYYHLSSRQFGKQAGGYAVFAKMPYFFNGGNMYQVKDGAGICKNPVSIINNGQLLQVAGSDSSDKCLLINKKLAYQKKKTKNKKGEAIVITVPEENWESKLPGSGKLFLKAGNIVYCGNKKGQLSAFDLIGGPQKSLSPVWRTSIKGEPWSMIAAGGKLFVVTKQGTLYCFGEQKTKSLNYSVNQKVLKPAKGILATNCQGIIKQQADKKGYCLVLGVHSEAWINELLSSTEMKILVIEKDPVKVRGMREKLDSAGVYGKRIAILNCQLSDLPPYFASLVLSEALPKNIKASCREIYRTLRPYGGAAYFQGHNTEQNEFKKMVTALNLPGAVTKIWNDGLMRLERSGPLPGSASWTHQYADAANSVVSKDKLVKLPLGILWFGGASNEKILPRHGHGPNPEVSGGRIIIEGRNILRALDVYTGRMLWETDIKDLGKFYDNTAHHPGANQIGSNYVSMSDGIYVITPKKCVALDPVNGKILKTFAVPKGASGMHNWGYIAVDDKYLIAATSPLNISFDKSKVKSAKKSGKSFFDIKGVQVNADYASASRHITVFDRYSGKILWSRPANFSFRHNAIIAGNGKLFCIDSLSDAKFNYLKRRGFKKQTPSVLYALDLKTGKVLWKTDENVFGTWLGYSTANDILVQAGSAFRDRARDETKKGLAAYNGTTGKLLWKNNDKYYGPCLLHRDKILTQWSGYDLKTGRKATMKNPLSKELIPWKFRRNYGCNTSIASENLLTFRSAAAGYFDLNTTSGTGNLGGFKSGCSSNLIAADGVLNAPDYTRTCTCSYQNQSSLALYHCPDVDTWTFTEVPFDKVKRLGINFGAPGDRFHNNTLWLEYPLAGSPSPKIPISVSPAELDTFRQHSSLIQGEDLKWVAASGCKGVEKIKLSLPDLNKCEIRMCFADPENLKAGERVFDVLVNGKKVIDKLDIIKETGQTNKTLIKEFKAVPVAGGILEISLKPHQGHTIISGFEIIGN